MVILLPSYRRTATLPWVLKSIFQADVSGINERVLILLHNNHPASRGAIDEMLAQKTWQDPFSVQVIHRDKTVVPLEGWFEALLSLAQEGETLMLLGDDDLITPWGIRNRHREINRMQGDFLLSSFVSRIYFFDEATLVWPDHGDIKVPHGTEGATDWVFTSEGHMHTTFISNHCYRNTPIFRKALALAFDWCGAQAWAGRVFATGLLPSYLPYTVQACGGKVLSLPERSVIRGSIFEEAIQQDYADCGTVSFYSLLALNTFSNPSLHKDFQRYADLREVYLKSLRAGLIENLFNRHITFTMLQDGLRATGLKWSYLIGSESFHRRTLLRCLPFFRGWHLKRVNHNRTALLATQQFIKYLRQLYEERMYSNF